MFFSISSAGVLTFDEKPNFEDPVGDGASLEDRNKYNVTIEASDGRSDNKDTLAVLVVVTNMDEDGTAEFSTEQPKELVPLTATLTDPDSDGEQLEPTDVTWKWARASSKTGTYTDIEGSIEGSDECSIVNNSDGTSTYTPCKDDVGKYLRATARYTDPEGAGKSANAVSPRATVRRDYTNEPPMFKDAAGKELPETTREIAENSRSGTNVGAPVSATDIGRNGRQETLTYTLEEGTDTDSFTINRRTGQIRVESGITLDSDTTSSYELTVIARDSEHGKPDENDDPIVSQATIDVVIKVTNVDETPEVTVSVVQAVTGNINDGYRHAEPILDSSLELSITFVGDDPEIPGNDNTADLTWTLTGTDADDFSIGNDDDDPGVLKFREKPNFETPTDSDRRNTYDVTVEATDEGGNTVSRKVRVTVTNEEEEGTVTLSHTQPEVGTSLTANLTDPDNPRSVTWQWYRGNPPAVDRACDSDVDSGCRIRDNANRATYTPVAIIDVDEFLTARASYMDGQGSSGRVQTLKLLSLCEQRP